MKTLKHYGYLWVTLVLFIGSFIGHWSFSWYAHVQEQADHGESPVVSEYLIEVSRATLENWQSEFLQLIWQVAGLSFLLYLGSPQSKESSERAEEKIDELLKLANEKEAETIIRRLDRKYPRA